MAKYKVGDLVKIREDLVVCRKYGTLHWWDGMRKLGGKILEITSVIDNEFYEVKGGLFISEEMIAGLAQPERDWKIIIHPDGNTTIATLYEDGKKVKQASAKCNPDDGYSIQKGAELAYNRMMYGTDYHPNEVAFKKKEEKPKLWNGKIRCVDNCHNRSSYTVGKIYTVKDGYVETDYGDKVGYGGKLNSFKDWAKFSASKWEEVKDDPEKPKLWNGRVVCVWTNESRCAKEWYTVGKVYDVREGCLVYDNGKRALNVTKVRSFEDFCAERSSAKWLEVVADDSKSAEPKEPKLWNGIVVCTGVKDDTYAKERYTVGKIYCVKDGAMVCDNGEIAGRYIGAYSFKEFCDAQYYATWLEVKE